MARTPYFDKDGVKKGAWSENEDQKLRTYIEKFGHSNWRKLPKLAGLSRCGKSCRLRWVNYLQPNIKRGKYTDEEEDLIINLHHSLGNKWSKIAAKLPGRSDNEIKNHWHTHLRKRVNQKTTVSYSGDELVQLSKCSKKQGVQNESYLKDKDEVEILLSDSIICSESSSDGNNEQLAWSLSSSLDHVAYSSQPLNQYQVRDLSSMANELFIEPMYLFSKYDESSTSDDDMLIIDGCLWH